MGTLTCVLLSLTQLVVSHKDSLTAADLGKNTHTRKFNVWLFSRLSAAIPRWAKVLQETYMIIKKTKIVPFF